VEGKVYLVVLQDAKRFYLVMELCTGGELFERIVAESASWTRIEPGHV